jgi:hypothetical protein
MAKRQISVKEIITDIRSGMGNTILMEKYRLSPSGLQSIFDKLLSAGAIDVAEIQDRMPGKWGTLAIQEEDALRLINAQEAARDIRSGMDDSSLTQKYQLSLTGLQTLFEKMVDLNAISQLDLADRRLPMRGPVVLGDDTADLRTIIDQLGLDLRVSGSDGAAAQPKESRSSNAVETPSHDRLKTSPEKENKKTQNAEEDNRYLETPWYENLISLIFFLIVLPPMGFYVLCRSSKISLGLKASITAVWIVLVTICLTLLGFIPFF